MSIFTKIKEKIKKVISPKKKTVLQARTTPEGDAKIKQIYNEEQKNPSIEERSFLKSLLVPEPLEVTQIKMRQKGTLRGKLGVLGFAALSAQPLTPGKGVAKGGAKLIKEAPEIIAKLKNLDVETNLFKNLYKEGVPLVKDIDEIKKAPIINIDNLKISDNAKKIIADVAEQVKPRMEMFTGKKLTNNEVVTFANKSQNIFRRAVDVKATKAWEASVLNLRREIASAAENGKIDESFVKSMIALKSAGTDVARKLQSLSIKASPEEMSVKEMMIKSIIDLGASSDDILKAAEGIDFNNFNQASEFYRKFIKPKTSEWVDLIRYNSMLSSPNTHMVNSFSNFFNTAIMAPIEKTMEGQIDFIQHAFTGKERTAFADEGIKYIYNYWKNVGQATKVFSEVIRGERQIKKLDLEKMIPIANKGLKGAAVKFLSGPMKFLEASDQFFSSLVEAGETAVLTGRQAKGINVGSVPLKAQQEAAYRLYRQDILPQGQGSILNAVDRLTNLVEQARNSPSRLVSTIAKFTIPFLRTPMNIVKQGIEYSPTGFLTMYKSADKRKQLIKAMIGSSIFTGAAAMVESGRITAGEPTNAIQKQKFRAAGRQSYSVKIGDKWVSYQKLPPPISFSLAMVANLQQLKAEGKITDSFLDKVLGAVGKYGDYLSEQSYAKGIGDILASVQGQQGGVARILGNYPQQMIPLRALGGWLARLSDDTQRQVDPDGTFIEKQIQQIMMNIPGLTQQVPARKDTQGRPIPYSNRLINSFSPARLSDVRQPYENKLKREEEKKAREKAYRDRKELRDKKRQEAREGN